MPSSRLIRKPQLSKPSKELSKFPNWNQLLTDITEEILRVFQYSDEGMCLSATQHPSLALFWDEFLLHHEKHPASSNATEIIEVLENYVLPLHIESSLEFRELTTSMVAFLSFAERILKWEHARESRIALRDWEMEVGDFFQELLEQSSGFPFIRLAS